MAGYAQPDFLPILKLTLGEVQVVEGAGALTPSNILSEGGTFHLRTEVSAEGILFPLLNLVDLEVQYHLENIQAVAAATDLPVPPTPVGAFPAPAASVSVLSGPFSVGAGSDLDVGTYRILVHVHCISAGLETLIGGFAEGPVVTVMAAP